MLNAANAVNTTSTYITGISAFEKFRVLTQLSVTWPPPLDQLVNFIAYLSPKKQGGSGFPSELNSRVLTNMSTVVLN